MKKPEIDWISHCCRNGVVCDECGDVENGFVENSCNAHTHGMNRYQHPDFQLVLEAELNFMMKTLLGSKLKDGLDKVVDGLVAMSEGRMPEGFDPSQFKQS